MSFFLGSSRRRRPPTLVFKCSAEMNSACAEVLPAAKRSYGPKAPPARRPVGWISWSFGNLENIRFSRPRCKGGAAVNRCPSLAGLSVRRTAPIFQRYIPSICRGRDRPAPEEVPPAPAAHFVACAGWILLFSASIAQSMTSPPGASWASDQARSSSAQSRSSSFSVQFSTRSPSSLVQL